MDRGMKIKPKQLKIVWGKDKRYWELPDKDDGPDENCFAELVQVSWLEVTAEAHNLRAGSEYSVGFSISMNEHNTSGWGKDIPVFLMAKVGKAGQYTWKKVTIDTSVKGNPPFNIPYMVMSLSLKLIRRGTILSTSVCTRSGVAGGNEVSGFTMHLSTKFF